MKKISYPESINKSLFSASAEITNTKFGLPRQVMFCTSCGVSNQRPNSTLEYSHTATSSKKTIHFDSDGVCDACKAAKQKKQQIDWTERESELRTLCDKFRSTTGGYDCLVPGSGGKDSFYAAHVLKHKYKMNPLTITWAPHIYTDWGWKNFQSWIHAGFDNHLITPNGRVHRLLTRLAVEKLFHPFQPFIFGQKSLAPMMACKLGIPLVFYGENEAEYGNPVADNESAKRDFSYFASTNKDEIFLGGVSVNELKADFGISDADLIPYMPTDPEVAVKNGVEVHYLGYYEKWHPQSCYYYAVEHGGFQASPERTAGTYSKYNSIDDKMDDLHFLTYGIKFGIGRATYDAAQEVRSGDITRDEAVALIRKYDLEFPNRFADELFSYLSIPEEIFPTASKMFEQPTMDQEYFMSLADHFRSPHLWLHENGEWKLRHQVNHLDANNASLYNQNQVA